VGKPEHILAKVGLFQLTINHNLTPEVKIMEVQKFILQHGLDALNEQFGITVKRYDNGYVKLNYSQIDSPKNHPISDECRGLTLWVKPDNTSKVITRGFKRFYNFGECDTASFNFDDCTAFEKCDGSLVLISYSPLDHKWIISTRGMAYAEGNFAFSLTASGGTFYDWILKAMQLTEEGFQDCMLSFDANYTFVCEYLSAENRVVTPYTTAEMVLLAVIHNETGTELTNLSKISEFLRANDMNIRTPITYTAASGAELVTMANSLPGLQEGFVVVNNKTRERVKIKSLTYVKMHHLRDGLNTGKNLIAAVHAGEVAEIIVYFPEMSPHLDNIVATVDTAIVEIDAIFGAINCVDQKQFAMQAVKTRYSGILFSMKKLNQSAHHVVFNCTQARFVDLVQQWMHVS
jgi:hypothetical protein